jgi:hypothetical protein
MRPALASPGPWMAHRTMGVVFLLAEQPPGLLGRLPPPRRFPPRSVEAILSIVETGGGDEISLMEWVVFLKHKPSWDAARTDGGIHAARTVWRFARTSPSLRRLLHWRLALAASGRPDVLPESLRSTFAEIAASFTGDGRQEADVLVALLAGPGGFAAKAMNETVTPAELLERVALPPWGAAVDKATEACAHLFVKGGISSAQKTDWLISCLLDLTFAPQVAAVDHILTTLPPELAGTSFKRLAVWLERWFGPARGKARWECLSTEGKVALRAWTGAIRYRDFERVAQQMWTPPTDIALGLDEGNGVYKLKSRVRFWERYQRQFSRLRIVLPLATHRLFSSEFRTLESSEVTTLKPDGTPDWHVTELGIFELGEWVAVQEFRGGGSGLRIFKGTGTTRRALFDAPIGISILRSIECEGVHDHVGKQWQHRCENWLRGFKVSPDPQTRPLPAPRYVDPDWEKTALASWEHARRRREQSARRDVGRR